MERLTKPEYHYHDCEFMDDGIAEYFNKLAAYENTGLEPEEIPQWIPVSERLPKTDGANKNTFNVLVYVPKREGCTQCGYFLGKLRKIEADSTGHGNFWGAKTHGSNWTLWGWSYFEEPIPSHWQPLPQPPKGEKL
jgi:hypothetical protein